jgi:hypothetical protein
VKDLEDYNKMEKLTVEKQRSYIDLLKNALDLKIEESEFGHYIKENGQKKRFRSFFRIFRSS